MKIDFNAKQATVTYDPKQTKPEEMLGRLQKKAKYKESAIKK